MVKWLYFLFAAVRIVKRDRLVIIGNVLGTLNTVLPLIGTAMLQPGFRGSRYGMGRAWGEPGGAKIPKRVISKSLLQRGKLPAFLRNRNSMHWPWRSA